MIASRPTGGLSALRLAALAAFGFIVVGAVAPAETGDEIGAMRARAYALYDEGQYGQAAEWLARLDDAGAADGSALYRLWYCLQATGDPAAEATRRRALDRLETEGPTAETLEPAFYLANAYRNLGRTADADRVASEAIERVAGGELAEPSGPTGHFRLGKLHADLGRTDEAVDWLSRAVDADAADEGRLAAPYRRWAARYLAERAWSADDYVGASNYYRIALEETDASWEDWDRLAVASCRAGYYLRASAAWHRAKRVDPARANRPRYAARIAQSAERLPALSSAAPDGRLWIELTRPELEAILVEQSRHARGLRAEAEKEMPLTPQRRAEVQRELDAAQAVFVGAAMEYVLQGHDIREAAFVGGFAPMVFKGAEWRAPAPPRGPRRNGS